MRILGIDTATSTASVALVENGAIIADERYLQNLWGPRSKLNQPKAGHAEIILPLIESVLTAARCSLPDLDGIAISIGPGSFTGLRIGLSTVKGLAYGWQRPVAGVSTLWANAARVTNFVGVVCSLLDARKKEVYVSFFRRTADALTRLTEDTLAPVSAVIDQARNLASDAPCLFIGEGAKVYENVLSASFGNEVRCCAGDGYPSLASAVARLGEERLRVSDEDFLGAMVPVYLRLSDAEMKHKELG
jgi:tRNA threonylcarbamoyladenosine biosynthesis protein TsaB